MRRGSDAIGCRGRSAARRWVVLALPTLGTAVAIWGLALSGEGPRAAAASPPSTPVAQPVIGLPLEPTLIGSSPQEKPGETWGFGETGEGFRVVRYTPEGGWQIQPQPLGPHGEAISKLKPAAGPLAGRTTPGGGVAILGEGEDKTQQLLVRNPGGGFQQAPALTTEPAEIKSKGEPGEPQPGESNALLRPGETLFAPSGEGVLMVPVGLEDNRTGVFLVPHESDSSVQSDVLFYDGSEKWAREPICTGVGAGSEPGEACVKPTTGFQVLAIDASSPENAWLLARNGSSEGEGVLLFSRRSEHGEARWVQRPLGPKGSLGAQFAQGKLTFEEGHEQTIVGVSALTYGQPLTVTGQGLWIDGALRVAVPGREPQSDSFTLYYDIGEGKVSASWCSVPAQVNSLCSEPLEAGLPGGPYRSFAWSEGGQYGERVITGFENGTTLSLHGDLFERVLGNGGESGTSAGAAFSSPTEGWLGPTGGDQLTHLTTSPEPNRVQPWPVPFGKPLTAIATQPGATPGELGAQAVAVGQGGQVAHYFPGRGWVSESLLRASGSSQTAQSAQTPNLRGVAWPEPNRIYAVGTDGAMWLWRAETGLWEPDPSRPPNLFLANFTGIAFDPGSPERGYAIGQQGLLLSYGKSWEPISPEETVALEREIGASERNLNFTSIAFADGEALVTYQTPDFEHGHREYTGGVLCNDGDGWRHDGEAGESLGGIPVRVAGLPDGSAAIADSQGKVIERQGPGTPCGSGGGSGSSWQPAPAGPVSGGTPVALAAFQEGSTLRAVVSVETGGDALSVDLNIDEALAEAPPEGQAPVFTKPYVLPGSGYLLRETAIGWRDEEHEDYPTPAHLGGVGGVDWPIQPDAVLALALPPTDGEGWAVGGQTGEINNNFSPETVEAIQTAGVMRYPSSGSAPTDFTLTPEQTSPGTAAFAIGGGAQCASACASLAEDKLGPDEWLATATERAAQTEQAGQKPGVRAFLYTGPRLSAGSAGSQREEDRYGEVLSSAGGSLGAYPAPSETDIDQEGNLGDFESIFKPQIEATHSGAGGSHTEPVSPPTATAAYYALRSCTAAASCAEVGAAERVRVIVLDYSKPALGEAQQCWLAQQLAAAKAEGLRGRPEPAIVIGQRAMSTGASTPAGANVAADASQVIPILVGTGRPAGCELETITPGAASAYFFEDPESNQSFPISSGASSILTYGSGTLGYVKPPTNSLQTEFLGASGFLLAEVEVARIEAAHPSNRNVAPVHVKLVPDISQLALSSIDGVLLRRSQASLFEAFARRPPAGMECREEAAACEFLPSPYVPIPVHCQGSGCATGIFPAYTFTSSNPDIGQFVEADPDEPKGESVLQGAGGKPIPEEPRNPRGELTADGQYEQNTQSQPINERGEVIPSQQSGLFCAYNPGTTTVTIRTGGLSYSEQVTVQGGSVEQPCGTVPLKNPPAPIQEGGLPVPLLAPAPAPRPTPTEALPPPPPRPLASPPPPAAIPPAARIHHATLPQVPQAQALLFPILPLLPPPAPEVARPTPPSGTAQVPSQSPVSQQVTAAEREEEMESAIQHVHHMAALARDTPAIRPLATAYTHPSEEAPLPSWPLGLVLLAAIAGGGIRWWFRAPRPVYARESPRR